MSTFENSNEVEEISSWFNWGTSPYDFLRFRQIEVSKKNPIVKIITRTGGGNREEYEFENYKLTFLQGYIENNDASWDSTYAVFKYKIPDVSIDKWHKYIEKNNDSKK
ncbi:hypothetical protein c7_L15 [Megavirus courdo7]|uniref:Uncharacterized protein n=1 Tax=Megavirus courdo7 TaxID=1128135 RepID=H2E9K8_9VIRU|nr:hypothetical protein c7_L15 [Megavirus courdo7]